MLICLYFYHIRWNEFNHALRDCIGNSATSKFINGRLLCIFHILRFTDDDCFTSVDADGHDNHAKSSSQSDDDLITVIDADRRENHAQSSNQSSRFNKGPGILSLLRASCWHGDFESLKATKLCGSSFQYRPITTLRPSKWCVELWYGGRRWSPNPVVLTVGTSFLRPFLKEVVLQCHFATYVYNRFLSNLVYWINSVNSIWLRG